MPEENKKRELPLEMKAKQFTKGQSGNPGGRPVGQSPKGAKLLSRFSQIIGRSVAHGSWFPKDLEYLKAEGLTVNELVAIMQMYCLATNTTYRNTNLLKTVYERFEGKIPLRVLHRAGEDADDYEALTDEELDQWIEERNRTLADNAMTRLQEKNAEPDNNKSGLEGTGQAPDNQGSPPPSEELP